jgi:hypothetical protein
VQTRQYSVIWLIACSTWLIVVGILAMVLVAGIQTEGGIGYSDSGGNTAALVLAAIAILPLFISRVGFVTKKWIPWLIGGISLALGIGMSLLSLLGLHSLSWSIYGGLQVLKASQVFMDLAWVIRWIDCEGCDAEETNYGSGLLWIKQLTFGQTNETWAIPVGFALIVIVSAALYWLARISSPGALPLYLLASFSSAWLLMADRANVDSFVFLTPFLVVLVNQRSSNLWSWSGLAIWIWWLGTWKFYPFALVLLLLPVLFIKRGWIILVGFAIATVVFVAVEWESTMSGFQANQINVRVNDFPAFGRTPIVARMGDRFDQSSLLALPNLLVFALALGAFFWGISYAKAIKTKDLPKGLLALGGSSMFLSNILLGGFGFAYKGPFLLLAVPLFALGLSSKNRFALYTSIVSILLIALSLMLSYSILLTSLASIAAASIAAGVGASACYSHLRGVYVSRPQRSKSENR